MLLSIRSAKIKRAAKGSPYIFIIKVPTSESRLTFYVRSKALAPTRGLRSARSAAVNR